MKSKACYVLGYLVQKIGLSGHSVSTLTADSPRRRALEHQAIESLARLAGWLPRRDYDGMSVLVTMSSIEL